MVLEQPKIKKDVSSSVATASLKQRIENLEKGLKEAVEWYWENLK
jgi:hypothetical protein